VRIVDDIIRKLNIETDRPDIAFKILLSSLRVVLEYSGSMSLAEYLRRRDMPSVLSPFKKLSREEIEYIDSMLSEPDFEILPIEECQVLVQKIIPQKKRKSLASYYTINIGTELMAKLASEYYKSVLSHKKGKITIADLFLGSGRTLTKAIKKIGPENIAKVYGIEPYFLSALVAYSALIQATNGKADVKVINGDAFKIISEALAKSTKSTQDISQPKQRDLFSFISKQERKNNLEECRADIVLTNPPFTRWSNLPVKYRNELIDIIKYLGYSMLLERKDSSLQILSMFLVDYVLNDEGLVVAVLPASTFYTKAGEGYKRLLRKRYTIKALLENTDSSFSEDSGFKEVILVAIKSRPNKQIETIFEKLTQENMDRLVDAIIYNKNDTNKVNLYTLPEILDRNWSFFFEDKELINLLLKITNTGIENESLIVYNRLFTKDSLIRGIEMYGTDFFFLPNKFWEIVDEDKDSITIRNKNTSKSLTINKDYLIKVLRKPQQYSDKIVVKADTYALSIPPGLYPHELDKDLEEYISWGESSGVAKKSIEAWKTSWSKRMGMWYSHIAYQIETKKPFGNIFLPDKVDSTFKNRGVFANFTHEKTVATKNFYILRIDDTDVQKILTLWFNSTIFIALFLATAKKISNRLIRLLGDDYLNGLILNPERIDNERKKDLLNIFKEIETMKFPGLKEQLHSKKYLELRRKLDGLILDIVGLKENDEILDKLYNILDKKLK